MCPYTHTYIFHFFFKFLYYSFHKIIFFIKKQIIVKNLKNTNKIILLNVLFNI